MTIHLGWWAAPAALFVAGLLLFIGISAWGRRNSHGSIDDALFGIAAAIACVLCWVTAIGICIGRWLS